MSSGGQEERVNFCVRGAPLLEAFPSGDSVARRSGVVVPDPRSFGSDGAGRLPGGVVLSGDVMDCDAAYYNSRS